MKQPACSSGYVPKPTLWAFSFFTRLRGQCVYRDEHLILLQHETGYEGILWQICKDQPQDLKVELSLPCTERAMLVCKRVDASHGNPLKSWIDMGQCPYPSKAQTALLRACAQPFVETSVPEQMNGCAHFQLKAEDNTVLHFQLLNAPAFHDDGYDEKWYR